MPLIQMKAEELFSDRGDQIKVMLGPLKSEKHLRCDLFWRKVAGGKAFIAHDGLSPRDDHRDYLFRLHQSQIECTYYEIWLPADGGARFQLLRAYFTVYVINRELQKLEELLCVHCDPADESEEPTRSYKRGPHLHVEKAEPPLPKCHFPLCLTNLEEVLSSPQSLTEALRKTAEVVQNEVVARFAEGR